MRARVVTERWAEGRSRPLLLSIDLRAARITATASSTAPSPTGSPTPSPRSP